jgi:hypothetical protein
MIPDFGPEKRKILASDPGENNGFQIIPEAKPYEHLHWRRAALIIPQP